jgi:hypothetical protein
MLQWTRIVAFALDRPADDALGTVADVLPTRDITVDVPQYEIGGPTKLH